MIDLPTLLVVVFLYGGNVYQEVQIAPSKEACMEVVKNIKTVLPKAIGGIPDAYTASCVTMKPFTRDS